MKSKLDKLVDDPAFGEGATDYDAGIMIYNKDSLNYITLIYDNYYEVYLSLYDDTRDYLAYGKANEFEMARNLAIAELEKIINNRIH